MNALIPLDSGTFAVRMVMKDGEPWWVLNDVCAILGIANPRHVASRLEDYQKGVAINDTLGGEQEMLVVNEPGIYSMTLASRKHVAKQFTRWLFTEVIPSIRKYGFYDPARLAAINSAPSQCADATPPTQSARLLEEIARYEERTGMSACTIPGISTPKLRQLALGAGVRKMLARNDLWLMLMSAGIDLYYVIFGQRQIEDMERQLLDTLREARSMLPAISVA